MAQTPPHPPVKGRNTQWVTSNHWLLAIHDKCWSISQVENLKSFSMKLLSEGPLVSSGPSRTTAEDKLEPRGSWIVKFIMFCSNLKVFFSKYCSKFNAPFIFFNRTLTGVLCGIFYMFFKAASSLILSLWCDYTATTIITIRIENNNLNKKCCQIVLLKDGKKKDKTEKWKKLNDEKL